MRHCNSALLAIVLAGLALSATAQLPKRLNVSIPITVSTKDQRILAGLKQESFQIFEESTQQEIGSFGAKDPPISVGILLDLSGSMTSKLIPARESILRFIKTSNPKNEYFIVGFDERPELIRDFTTSVEDIQASLTTLHTGHHTALLDAIDSGLDKMKDAHDERKVLLVVSDGVDNSSRHTDKEVRTRSGASNVEIYAIGLIDPYAATPEERTGPLQLNEFCEETGGRVFRVSDPSEMSGIAEIISTELRNQYVIGYTPRDLHHDGKWRKVKVKLNPPQGLPPLTVHARTGYYAPLQ